MDEGNSCCRLCLSLVKLSPPGASAAQVLSLNLFVCEKESPRRQSYALHGLPELYRANKRLAWYHSRPAHSHKHQTPPVAYLFCVRVLAAWAVRDMLPTNSSSLTSLSLVVQTIPPAVITAMADLFPSMPVYLRSALERAIAAISSPGCYKLMDLRHCSFMDSAYSVNITSCKLRKLAKPFHVPFFILGSGFMGPC